MTIVSVEGPTIFLTGFNAPLDDAEYAFTVDILTGCSADKPYDW